jgi:hypothetical protein
MFSLTVIDHLRLDSEQAARNYAVHAREAERLVGIALVLRIATASSLAISLAAEITNLIVPLRAYQAAAVAASAAALIAFALYCVFGFDARIAVHRALAHRLWLVSERYRSLLAEIEEGIVERDGVLRRRDELIDEMHAIYAHGFAADHRGHEAGRLPTLDDRAA